MSVAVAAVATVVVSVWLCGCTQGSTLGWCVECSAVVKSSSAAVKSSMCMLVQARRR